MMLIREAKEITGGLSDPSKMPGKAYGTPAARCLVGSRLRQVAGSVCEYCYADRGNYRRYPAVRAAQERRFASLGHPDWVEAMALLIGRQAGGWFRWHDSGDLHGVEHLGRICQVAELTPEVRHWLPTREYTTVRRYLAEVGPLPENLTVRLSAHMVGQYRLPEMPGCVWSVVVPKGEEAPEGVHRCPAPDQGGECGTCRGCWSDQVEVVAYGFH